MLPFVRTLKLLLLGLWLLLPQVFAIAAPAEIVSGATCPPSIFKDFAKLARNAEEDSLERAGLAFDPKQGRAEFKEMWQDWDKSKDEALALLQKNNVGEPLASQYMQAVDLMMDPDRFYFWFVDLKTQILKDMIRAKDRAAIELYKKNGILPQSYMVKRLRLMAKEHGYSGLVSLPNQVLGDKAFMNHLRKGGVLLDRAFGDGGFWDWGGGDHGSLTHAFQMLYVSTHFDYPDKVGAGRAFFNLIADHPSGPPMFGFLFDSLEFENLTQPEVLKPALQQVIPFQDKRRFYGSKAKPAWRKSLLKFFKALGF